MELLSPSKGGNIGYIKKFTGHFNGNFFDSLADRSFQKGILMVCSLKEDCKHCEDIMVLIQNFQHGFVRKPSGLTVIYGVNQPKGPKSKGGFEPSTAKSQIISSEDFEWDRIKTHGVCLFQSSVNYSVLEDNHSLPVLTEMIKNMFRRLSTDIYTKFDISCRDELINRKTSGVILQYTKEVDEKTLFYMENLFSFFYQKYKLRPIFIEASKNEVEFIIDGEPKGTTAKLEVGEIGKLIKKNSKLINKKT